MYTCCFYSRGVSYVCVFKQKTAYEMRISDWSSDVCSSDLILFDQDFAGQATGKRDELCTGPRMQAALVRDLHLSPVSGHVDVPSSSDATLIYFWPASRAAAPAFCTVLDLRALSRRMKIGRA